MAASSGVRLDMFSASLNPALAMKPLDKGICTDPFSLLASQCLTCNVGKIRGDSIVHNHDPNTNPTLEKNPKHDRQLPANN